MLKKEGDKTIRMERLIFFFYINSASLVTAT